MKREKLLDYLQSTKDAFYAREIDDAIILHFDLMLEHYERKPFFCKALMKHDRLMVVMTLFAFHYRSPLTPLSQVREFCVRRGYLSRNSLESYFSFLLVTGYMHIEVHPDDARFRIYTPSTSAIDEAARFIKAYLIAGDLLLARKDGPVTYADATALLKCFFTGFVRLLDADILLDNLLPEANWIMNRDGGHLPMLALYLDALRYRSSNGRYKVSTYAELSSRLHVSKTHVMRLVRDGEAKGYFRCCGSAVQMRPAFADTVRQTMAINFAVARISIELGTHAKEDKSFSRGSESVS